MTKEEVIREEIRKVINQMLDEEFERALNEVKEGRAYINENFTKESIQEFLKEEHKEFREKEEPKS